LFKLLKSAFSKVAETLKPKKDNLEKAVTAEETKEEPKEEKLEFKESVEKSQPKPTHEESVKTAGPLKEEHKQEKVILVDPSLKTKLKSLLKQKFYLSENDLKEVKEKFELALLQSDFSIEIINFILDKFVDKIRAGIEKGKNIDSQLKDCFVNSLFEMIVEKDILFSFSHKPVKIMFIGPNGCGKTTTIAKLANLIQENNKKVILSASDTFRVASIEQLREHANNLSVPIVSGNYGGDPTSVAFDAVTLAKNNGYDYVLIDTAGRQETNSSLRKELEKLKRVIKPDLIVYVAESVTGQAVVNQVKEFDKEIGIDAFIVTKADIDSKGGTAFSLNIFFKKPILFLGTGQGYNDLILFKKDALQGLFE